MERSQSDDHPLLVRADWAWVGVLLLLVLGHGLFLALDGRVVADDVHMLEGLPLQGAPGALLVQSGGWLKLLFAAVLEPRGYPPTVARGLFVGFALVVPLNAALLARRLGGPGAALAAAALTGAAPMVSAWGRTAWFHVPEAALVTTMAVLWARDPRLERWWTAWVLGGIAALAVLLRPSGLLWTLTLLPLAWPALRARWPRLLPVAVAWAVAAIVPLVEVGPYLWAKLEARERYVSMVEPLHEQIGMMVVWWVLLLCLVGAGLRLGRRRLQPVEWTTLIWAVLPWVMVVVFRAGLDNHTLLVPGLAVLAGVGLARWAWAPWVAVGGLVVQTGLTWLPSPPLAGLVTPDLRIAIQDYNRPYDEVGAEVLRERIRASCRAPGYCVIATEQGLFHPFSKGDERFEVAQLGLEDVDVLHVHRMNPRMPGIRALTSVRCTEDYRAFHQLDPGAHPAADDLRRRLSLQEVARWDLSPECVLVWEELTSPR